MKTIKKILIAIAVAGISGGAIANTSHGYRNPVIPGFYPDPSVCRVGEDFYLVNSSFQFFPGVPIFHSKDLIHWEQIGNVLDRESQLPLKEANSWLGIYAPTIRHHDGLYYMVTTNVGNDNAGRGNFFVTATDPAGPWSDPIWLDQGGIDPSFFFEDGKTYFSSNPDGAIWLCEIDPVTGKQLTESRRIWGGDGGRYPEAAHIYKKDGWYYLMIAEGGTEMGHSETIARSRDIYGPYESNPANPILYHLRQAAQDNPIQGTGHADLTDDGRGGWWIVNLAFRPQTMNQHLTGRETYLAPVEWNAEGWPVVNGGGIIYEYMDVPTLPQSDATSRSRTYDFTSITEMPFNWMYLRNPHFENYSLSRDGLRLKATSEGLDSMESPTFVAVRQQDIEFEASAILSLSDATSGTKAGISVYMDAGNHYDINLVQDKDGSQAVKLEYRLNSLSGDKSSATTFTSGEDVKLIVKGSKDTYEFFYSSCSGQPISLGKLDSRYLSTETAGGFTGITLGLFAEGNGTATVRNFSYLAKD